MIAYNNIKYLIMFTPTSSLFASDIFNWARDGFYWEVNWNTLFTGMLGVFFFLCFVQTLPTIPTRKSKMLLCLQWWMLHSQCHILLSLFFNLYTRLSRLRDTIDWPRNLVRTATMTFNKAVSKRKRKRGKNIPGTIPYRALVSSLREWFLVLQHRLPEKHIQQRCTYRFGRK